MPQRSSQDPRLPSQGTGERVLPADPIDDRRGGVAPPSTERDASAPGRAPTLNDEDFRVAFELAPLPMALISLGGQFLKVNQAMCKLTGYGENDLLEMNFRVLTHADDLASELPLVGQMVSGEIDHYEIEKRNYNARGQTSWLLKSAALVRNRTGEPSHLLVQYLDVSERKMFEDRVRYYADHDSLTGLRSRRVFEADLAAQAARCERYNEQAVLMIVDVDGFKQINDQLGHRMGDAVLVGVANGLMARVRAGDLTARVGGDEFAAIMPKIDEPVRKRIIQDIRTAVESSVTRSVGAEIRATVSIGLAPMSAEHCDVEVLLVEADRAMYADKRSRKKAREQSSGAAAEEAIRGQGSPRGDAAKTAHAPGRRE